MNKLLTALLHAVRDSGEYLKENAFQDPLVNWKERGDPVTELDRNVERKIKADLLLSGYDFDYLGEEFGGDGNRSDYTVVIDPIDGTKSFLRRDFNSAISLAVVDFRTTDAQPIAGVVHDFMRDITYIASSQSTYLIYQGKPEKIPKKIDFGKISINIDENFKDLREKFEGHPEINIFSRSGSIALNMAQLGIGSYDGLIEPPGNKGNVWDVAAGVLYMGMRGIEITDFQGNPYDVWKPRNGIIALRPEIRKRTLEILAQT
jgi:myo-inositol-1(or 4)-monophosphatase